MRNCLEAARLAPSSCNKQPWRFVIVREREMIRRIAGEGLLPGIKMTWLNDASAIAVLCAKTDVKVHWLAPILSGIQYHLVDLGIAGEHFCLAAEAQGLGTCWIGWFKPKAVAQMLGIPSGIQPTALIRRKGMILFRVFRWKKSPAPTGGANQFNKNGRSLC